MMTTSKRLQRIVMLGLSGVALTGLLRVLLLPRQPTLPEVPAVLAVGDDWERQPAEPVRSRRRSHPPLRAVAVGDTHHLKDPSGQWLLLTPLAAWNAQDLDPEAAVRGIVGLELEDLSRFTPESGGWTRQLAKGATDGAAQAYQTCMTDEGQAAHGGKEMTELVKHRDPPFFTSPLRNLKRMLWPIEHHTYSCLLLTTNSAELLSESTLSTRLMGQLKREMIWPTNSR
jgi:hypothetical protein